MRAPPLHPPPDRVLRSLSGFGAHDHREGRMMRPSRGPADCGPLRIHGSRWRLVGGRVTGREPARGVARPCRQTCGRVGWCYLPTAPGDGPPPLISPLAHGGPSQALVCTTRPLWGPADGGPFRTHGSMQVWWGGRPRGGGPAAASDVEACWVVVSAERPGGWRCAHDGPPPTAAASAEAQQPLPSPPPTCQARDALSSAAWQWALRAIEGGRG